MVACAMHTGSLSQQHTLGLISDMMGDEYCESVSELLLN